MTKIIETIRNYTYIIVTILTFAGLVVVSFASMSTSIQLNTDHRLDTDVHMPLQKKEEHFVTRREFEQFKTNQEEMLKILRDMKN